MKVVVRIESEPRTLYTWDDGKVFPLSVAEVERFDKSGKLPAMARIDHNGRVRAFRLRGEDPAFV